MQKKRKRWATSSPFSKKYRLYMCNLCTAEKGRFFFHFCVHACAYGRMLFEVSRIKFHWIGLLCWKSVFYDFATSSSALNSFHFFFHGSEKNCLFSCSIVSIGIHLMGCQTVFFLNSMQLNWFSMKKNLYIIIIIINSRSDTVTAVAAAAAAGLMCARENSIYFWCFW